jgi:hypothetical protein
MEDDLTFFVNGRRPHVFVKTKDKFILENLKTTESFPKCSETIFRDRNFFEWWAN